MVTLESLADHVRDDTKNWADLQQVVQEHSTMAAGVLAAVGAAWKARLAVDTSVRRLDCGRISTVDCSIAMG